MVERVAGRLTWPRVLGGGAGFGLLVVVLLSLFCPGPTLATILIGLLTVIAFGAAVAAASYASLRGRRDFVSTTQIVASPLRRAATVANRRAARTLERNWRRSGNVAHVTSWSGTFPRPQMVRWSNSFMIHSSFAPDHACRSLFGPQWTVRA